MRKLRLTPLQNQILWILKEAGEESQATVVAILCSRGQMDTQAISEAEEGLKELALVEINKDSISLTPSGYANFRK
jgi:hypothetical protein